MQADTALKIPDLTPTHAYARLKIPDLTPIFARGRDVEGVRRLDSGAYTIPTSTPEADGTLEWDSTTLVTVHVDAADARGFGYTYAHAACEPVIRDLLAPIVIGRDPMDITGAWQAMRAAVRNNGRTGLAAAAISAVDNALWDLKARLLNLPVALLLGRTRETIAAYGSGGFTSYSDTQLREQFTSWAELGIRMMKMKVGREPLRDPGRVRAARQAIGDRCELFVDANGAYSRKQALAIAERVAEESRVSWFEEPVPSDDLEGLRLLVDRAPADMDIAAGEYAYDLPDFRRLVHAGAVDVLQADATRCCGTSGFLRAAALCEVFGVPLSAHTAPTLHAHLCCAAAPVRHVEYFHDHARIEQMLFDGALIPCGGVLKPDLTRPGFGVTFKEPDAEPYST